MVVPDVVPLEAGGLAEPRVRGHRVRHPGQGRGALDSQGQTLPEQRSFGLPRTDKGDLDFVGQSKGAFDSLGHSRGALDSLGQIKEIWTL